MQDNQEVISEVSGAPTNKTQKHQAIMMVMLRTTILCQRREQARHRFGQAYHSPISTKQQQKVWFFPTTTTTPVHCSAFDSKQQQQQT